jgi:hypothetical protein
MVRGGQALDGLEILNPLLDGGGPDRGQAARDPREPKGCEFANAVRRSRPSRAYADVTSSRPARSGLKVSCLFAGSIHSPRASSAVR